MAKSKSKSKAKAGVTTSPILSYKYRIEIEGLEVIGFKEMAELSNETEIHEYKEGGLNGYIHKFPSNTSFSNVELKHGLSLDDTFHDWRQLVIDGNMKDAKKNGTIKVYAGTSISKIWSFEGAWLSKLEVSGFDATSNDVLIESVELVIEKFERKPK